VLSKLRISVLHEEKRLLAGWEEYLELLLSVCSQYDRAQSTTRPTQRNVHATNLAVDEDYFSHPDHTSCGIDTDLTEIYANATQTTVPGSGTSQFLPRNKWLKLTQEQPDEINAKRRNSMGNSSGGHARPSPQMHRLNTHMVEDRVHLDDIIEYTINTHLVQETDNGEDTTSNPPPDLLLAHMAGCSASVDGSSPGDI
jgi:hypothetical protein